MKASAAAHPNIALIKYWGKNRTSGNLPAVDSLSVTLAAMRTQTEVDFGADVTEDELILNGRPQPYERGRLKACLDALRTLAGTTRHARVRSDNDFPTGAGLASSASGYAALVTAGAAALGLDPGDPRLHDAARIGSGSAPRSLMGGFVVLRRTADGTQCEQLLAPDAWPLDVVIAVVSESEKAVSSRDGMTSSQQTSPYYASWVATHAKDMSDAQEFIRNRDFSGLAATAEHNCLKMHAVMLASRPALIYWTPATIGCIEVVQDMRSNGVPVFFTIDAGPQVKAICLSESTELVASALSGVPGVQRVMTGGLGSGPMLIGK